VRVSSVTRCILCSGLIAIRPVVADPPNPGASPTPVSVIDDSPMPEGTPSSPAAPALLPKSDLLPAAPPLIGPVQPPNPARLPGDETVISPKISPEQRKIEDGRLHMARVEAMNSARAQQLLQESQKALDPEARRNYLRAYYYTVCAEMRRKEPALRSAINEFEREQIHRLAYEGRALSTYRRTSTLELIRSSPTPKKHKKH
jgi:hypothetical protein